MFNWFKKTKPTPAASKPKQSFYDTVVTNKIPKRTAAKMLAMTFQKNDFRVFEGGTMDDYTDPRGPVSNPLKLGLNYNNNIPENQFYWFARQGFIGYPMCATFSQNWLIDKACSVPSRDAVRNGYKINVDDGQKVDQEILDALNNLDRKMDIKGKMVEFITMGRVFGLRIALFVVQSTDPLYYENPFNPDGIIEGSYKGISQIDPDWAVPELSRVATSDPAALDFYVPTYWIIGGKRYHKSHLIISIPRPVPDRLKPTYNFGGKSIPQLIFERVFGAERTANEAPQLALTKRTTALFTDVASAMLNQSAFEERLALGEYYRDNFQKLILNNDETMEQFETSLSGLEEIIDGQYNLVAAASNMPVTKLMGTSAKGLNATGEGDESSYHEELESIQEHDLSPLLQRHHIMCIRSTLVKDFPELKTKPFTTHIAWNPLDAMTAKELAELNNLKADTDEMNINMGAIDNDDVRTRLANDPDSGYTNLTGPAPEPDPAPNSLTVKPYEKFKDAQA